MSVDDDVRDGLPGPVEQAVPQPAFDQPLTPEQEIELRRLELAHMKEEREALREEREYNARAYRDTSRVATLEAYIRAILAGILVIGTIAAVFVGIVRGISGSDLSQYLAPITGLAGLAVGYFFGRGSVGQGEQPNN